MAGISWASSLWGESAGVVLYAPRKPTSRRRHDSQRSPFFADPGSDQRPGPCAACDGAADDRPPRPRVRRARSRAARKRAGRIQDEAARRDLSRVGHGRVGSRAREHAVAGRHACSWSRPANSRRFGSRWRSGWGSTSSCCRPTGGTARTRTRSRTACARTRADDDQGRLRGAQRDLDRRREPDRGRAQGDRLGGAPGAAAGRHDLLARLDRLPDGRVGRRRDRRRLAEGAHAAAGLELQRDLREGARREQDGEAAEELLGLGRHAQGEQDGLFPVHAGDESALRPARGARDARGRGARERIRAPRRGMAKPRGALSAPGASRCSVSSRPSTAAR